MEAFRCGIHQPGGWQKTQLLPQQALYFLPLPQGRVVAANLVAFTAYGGRSLRLGAPVVEHGNQRFGQLFLAVILFLVGKGDQVFAVFFLEHAAQYQNRHQQVFEAFIVSRFKPVGIHHVQRVQIGIAPRPVVGFIIIAVFVGVQDQVQLAAIGQYMGSDIKQLLQQGFQLGFSSAFSKAGASPNTSASHILRSAASGPLASAAKKYFVRAHGAATDRQGRQQLFQPGQIGVIEYDISHGALLRSD
jgi:hypothetical protein